MNSGVTALMAQPLSKRAQQLSLSILTQAIFSGPPQQVSGSEFRKGGVHVIFMLGEFCLGRFAKWQLTSE